MTAIFEEADDAVRPGGNLDRNGGVGARRVGDVEISPFVEVDRHGSIDQAGLDGRLEGEAGR